MATNERRRGGWGLGCPGAAKGGARYVSWLSYVKWLASGRSVLSLEEWKSDASPTTSQFQCSEKSMLSANLLSVWRLTLSTRRVKMSQFAQLITTSSMVLKATSILKADLVSLKNLCEGTTTTHLKKRKWLNWKKNLRRIRALLRSKLFQTF